MDRRKRGHGLEYVHFIPTPAWTRSTTTNKKFSAGLSYEKKVLRLLFREFPNSEIFHGLWLEYKDHERIGYAQPDMLILGDHNPIIVECKYTFTRAGLFQLNFYHRLLSHIWHRPIHMLLVAKRLTRLPKTGILTSCPEVLTSPYPHNILRHS